MQLLNYANKLFEKNLIVIPIKDKKPYSKSWQTTTEFPNNWNTANGVGILLGEKSGIICLDFDVPIGDERAEKILKLLPPILCGAVGNPNRPAGIFFKYNGEKTTCGPIEILSTGTQKAVPPSAHPEHGNYTWVGSDIVDIDVDDLPILPPEVLEILNATPVEDVAETVEDGRCRHGSNNLLSALGVKLFYQGFDFKQIVSELLSADEEYNKDAQFTYFSCPKRGENARIEPEMAAWKFVLRIYSKHVPKLEFDETFFGDDILAGFTVENEDGKKIRKIPTLYQFFKGKNDPHYCETIKGFFVWNGKYYETKRESYAKGFAQSHYKNPICTSSAQRSEFLDYCRFQKMCEVDDFVLRDTGSVNFKNGIYLTEEKRLIEHDRKYKFSHIVPNDWTNEVSAPVWEAFLDLVSCGRPHIGLFLEEFGGYALTGCDYTEHSKIAMLGGAGANGKSTFVNLLKMLLGLRNCSSVQLDHITNNRFSSSGLYNKLLNSCDEIEPESFTNTGIVKALTGGDTITIERKHEHAFEYNNVAKLILSYNKPPAILDSTIGMRRRIVLVPFDLDLKAEPHKKIEDIYRKIRRERGAILNRLLLAFRDVQVRGEFTPIPEGVAALEEIFEASDPVLNFVSNHLLDSKDPNHFVSSQQLWNGFLEMCDGNTRMKRYNFLKRLKRVMADRKIGVVYRSKTARGYSNVILSNGDT